MSIFSHVYNIAIDRGVGAPVNGKYIVDGMNATDKNILPMLIINLQLPGAATNDSYMVIHSAMSNTDISLARVF